MKTLKQFIYIMLCAAVFCGCEDDIDTLIPNADTTYFEFSEIDRYLNNTEYGSDAQTIKFRMETGGVMWRFKNLPDWLSVKVFNLGGEVQDVEVSIAENKGETRSATYYFEHDLLGTTTAVKMSVIQNSKVIYNKINGRECVDMGLSVKWANYNLGSANPFESGDYYDWNNSLSVRNKWGGTWRVPSTEEWQELIDNCEWFWTRLSGNICYKCVSKINGAYIYFPVAGYYVREYGTWGFFVVKNSGVYGYYRTSTVNEDDEQYADIIKFDKDGFAVRSESDEFRGSVRPVAD